MALSDKLRKARRLEEISQEDLSIMAKIDKASIFNLEKDKTDPRWSTVVKLVKALKLSDEPIKNFF